MGLTRIQASAIALAIAVACVAAVAAADEKSEVEPTSRCSMCSMAEGAAEDAGEAGSASEKLKEEDASEDTKASCPMMKKMSTSPEALLAMKGELDLSDQQIRKLERIVKKARAQAKAVLKKDQQKKLEDALAKWNKRELMQCPMMKVAERPNADKKRESKKATAKDRKGKKGAKAKTVKAKTAEPKKTKSGNP